MNRRLLVLWCGAVMAAAVCVLAMALLLGGGAPPPAPPGLPDDDRLPAWIGTIVGLVSLIVGIVALGLGLLGSGALDRRRRPALGAAGAVAVLWAALGVLQIGLAGRELGGRVDLFDVTRIRALLVQVVLAVLAAVCFSLASVRAAATIGVVAALVGPLPLVLAGHARSAEHPWAAGVAVSAHVAASSVWIGGLAALAWLAIAGDRGWTDALPRYSRLALVSVVALAAAGIVSAATRLDAVSELLTSRYGAIVTLKLVAFAGLVAAGWMQRAKIVGRATTSLLRQFIALAAVELTVMAMAVALAVALARTPPPA